MLLMNEATHLAVEPVLGCKPLTASIACFRQVGGSKTVMPTHIINELIAGEHGAHLRRRNTREPCATLLSSLDSVFLLTASILQLAIE